MGREGVPLKGCYAPPGEININIEIQRYSKRSPAGEWKSSRISLSAPDSRNIRFLCMDAQDIADVFPPAKFPASI